MWKFIVLTDHEERYQAQPLAGYAEWDNHGDGVYNQTSVDGVEDDRLWLVTADMECSAEVVVIDIDSVGLVDARIQVVKTWDFDRDGVEDDARYTLALALSGRRVLHLQLVITVYDYDCDFAIDKVEVKKG